MQSNLAFVLSQVTEIEQAVFKRKYPSVRYPELVPVSTSAWAWAPTITHFATDFYGEAGPVAQRGDDFPIVKRTHEKFDVQIEMDGIAYEHSIQEVEQARRLRLNLNSEDAMACRLLAERRIDHYVINGQSDYGWDSLFNSSKITKETAAGTGSGSSTYWKDKSAENILLDINNALESVYVGSNTVEVADTLLLPPNIWSNLVSKFINGTSQSVLRAVRENNVYTMKTGNPLMIRECRGLEKAGPAGVGRAIVYTRTPETLRLHLPMPFRFMKTEYFRMKFFTPGIFRCGGLEIRLPGAMRYLDGISAAA